MEYIVLEFITLKMLIRSVNEHIKNGYKCQGGVSFSSTSVHTNVYTYYLQAMIKD